MSGTTELPCKQCGAQLSYSPGTLSLVCPYCGTENRLPGPSAGPDAPPRAGTRSPWETERTDPADTTVVEHDLEEALATLERAEAGGAEIETTTTTRCPGCGAEVELGSERLAGDCPFCATPLAKEPTHDHRHPAPEAVLPFTLDQGAARKRMKDWLASRWFAPSSLTRYAEAGRPLRGVYVPHYTFDAAADARYRGQRGDAYYVTRTVMRDGKRQKVQERRIRWTAVSGRIAAHYDDVLVPASATLTEFAAEAEVQSRFWDLHGALPYDRAYLSGFTAEAPSLPLREGFGRATRAMEVDLRQRARRDIGGDEQRVAHLAARYSRVTFKHLLLPVWLAAYRWKNRPYRVVINARTGHVRGERPYSWTKIALAVLLALVFIAGAAFLAQSGTLDGDGGGIRFEIR